MLYKIAQESLLAELVNLTVHKDSIEIMQGKANIIPIKLVAIRTPAANIIKQEM